MDVAMNKANELGAAVMTMGEAVQAAGDLGSAGMGFFIDATIAAARGSKKSYGEMGKLILKWAADSLKAMAATAAGKAIYYMAESFALASNPLTAALAPTAMAAAKTYGIMAAYAGTAAVGVGMISANNAPSGNTMSQSEREDTTGLADDSGYGGERTITQGRLAATNMTVTHIYNGSVYFGSQDLATAGGIQEVIDTGELYFEGTQ
jgi:hypothetical protein